jgi:hypothetical protein
MNNENDKLIEKRKQNHDGYTIAGDFSTPNECPGDFSTNQFKFE